MAERRSGSRWATPLVCLALFAAALLARLYRLDAQSLWLDEGSSWQLSQAGWAYLAGELLNPSAAYPLYHLILKGWMALFGDSEAALRMPSAIAGALAVPAVYLAAVELERLGGDPHPPPPSLSREEGRKALTRSISPYALAAALVILASPYAIWYSQEAKVYSMLLLASAVFLWAVARVMRTGRWEDWAIVIGVGVAALWVHRLAGLLLAAGVWAVAVQLFGRRQLSTSDHRPQTTDHGRSPPVGRPSSVICGQELGRGLRLALLALAALLSAALVAAMIGGLGGEYVAGRSAAGAGIPAGPALALGLTFVRFSLDRWPGDAPWWWLAPWALLAAWGLARLLLDLRDHTTRPRALLLLAFLVAPLALFLAQLGVTRLYEARYLTVIFPSWALLLAYPLAGGRRQETGDRRQEIARPETRDPRPETGGRRPEVGGWKPETGGRRPVHVVFGVCTAAAIVTGGLALVQPTFGLFSGDAVKEQYREAIGDLAARVHPDDAVVVHPSYLRPLYAYYMGRLTADPAPEPIVFGDFWQGETDYGQREWDLERRAKLAGHTRSLLLIAPDHARTVDRPLPGDEYGLVGNYWAYSREQRTWPCGIWRYNGAHLLCQEAPEPYYTGAPAPEPETPSSTTFGDNLRLLGYTLKATTPEGPGVYRAGGNLPISLFWDVGQTPATDLSLFLHLCQQCDMPPVAGEDGPPLEGYLPTSTWLPGKPARDDRAISLPRDTPPGRYTLLLGVYDPTVPSLSGRLPATGGEGQGGDRLVLGTVEIIAADDLAAGGTRP